MTQRREPIARPTLAMTRAIKSNSDPSWTAEAPCQDWWLFDLPPYHAKMTAERLYTAMLPALQICAGCPFGGIKGECVQRVAPAESWYDGVAGGFVWRNGKRLRLRRAEPLEVAS